MAQNRVNGSAADAQFLSGALAYFTVDAVSTAATANLSARGFTAGSPDPGQKMINLIQTVCSPVIIEGANSRVIYIAVEAAPGVTAAQIQAAIRTETAFATSTVTSGSFSVS